MPTYRVEEASTGRAGCKNKECQDKKEKILKGELRLGTWVETEQFQSWAWKHWGCVTPKQIASLKEGLGEDGDLSELDGFDELSEENQKKIREAVAQGHVADEDWRGDIEMNRPGKTGFRVRASKKKDKDEPKAEESKKDQKKPVKKRGKRAAADDEEEEEKEEEEEAPSPKKAKTAGRKKKTTASQQSGHDEGEKTKPGRKSGKASNADASKRSTGTGDAESAKASRDRRAARRAAKAAE
ncbi:hypothetical protein VTO42DRAFT_5921 [Malbranchea cinnamomea]